MNSAVVYVVIDNGIVDGLPSIEMASLLFEVEKIGSVFGMVANARMYFSRIESFNLNLNWLGRSPDIRFRDEITIIFRNVIIIQKGNRERIR